MFHLQGGEHHIALGLDYAGDTADAIKDPFKGRSILRDDF